MLTVQAALQQGSQLLKDGGIPEPRLTAEVLLMHAVRRDRAFLYAHNTDPLTELQWIHYGRYLHERLKGKPTQYITHEQEFYGRPFLVSPDVLIPRPETEHVVERALEISPRPRTILDIGCGSGALAITLALELGAQVVATDISEAAARVAQENAARLAAPVRFLCCDLAGALTGPSFDLIVSNPPYVPEAELEGLQREIRDFEPHIALTGGPTGVELYHRIVPQAAQLLHPRGWLIFEIGYRSEAGVRAAFNNSWSSPYTGYDLAGLPRVMAAQYTP